MPIQTEKVYAYITHQRRLLVFTQPLSPEAGIQVPGGTIEPSELPEVAVMREAEEETGLTDLHMGSCLGAIFYDCAPRGRDEIAHRHFYHLVFTGEPPETWQHLEAHPSTGDLPEIPFDLFWVDLDTELPELVAGMGELLPLLMNVLPSQ